MKLRKLLVGPPRTFSQLSSSALLLPPASNSATMHPQIAIHKLSLLKPANAEEQTLHAPKDSGDSTTGNLFWLNAARQIDWIKQPKVAYGVGAGEQVRCGRGFVGSVESGVSPSSPR